MSVRVSLRGMLRLIRVNNLRRVHNVGFSRDGSCMLFACVLFMCLLIVICVYIVKMTRDCIVYVNKIIVY